MNATIHGFRPVNLGLLRRPCSISAATNTMLKAMVVSVAEDLARWILLP